MIAYYLNSAAVVWAVIAALGLAAGERPGEIIRVAFWYAVAWPVMLGLLLAEAWYFWRRK